MTSTSLLVYCLEAEIVMITASEGKSLPPDYTVDGVSESSITPEQRSVITKICDEESEVVPNENREQHRALAQRAIDHGNQGQEGM